MPLRRTLYCGSLAAVSLMSTIAAATVRATPVEPPAAVSPALMVGRIPLPRMVKYADTVAVALVTRVDGARGEELAEAEVEAIWKGEPASTLRFRAHGTWTCDTSTAHVGERVLLFLSAFDDELGARHLLHSGRGRMPLTYDDAVRVRVSDVVLPDEDEQPARARSLAEFEELVTAYVQQQSEAGVAALREELLAMYAVDQRSRDIEHMLTLPEDEQQAFMAEGAAADARHLARMKEIFYVHGWPDHALVGEQASHAAFVLVQHADADPDFQWRMLWPLREAVERGEASAAELAYLTDRVNVARGKPQVYGTQYSVQTDASGAAVADADGKLTYLLPEVESVDRLDERRAEAGLGPWIEYERRMAASQGREPEARPILARR